MKKLFSVLALALIAATSHANTCTIRQAGATDQTVYVTLLDATTGAPTAGLAFNSSGIDLEYVRTAAAAVDITEATQTAAGAHSDGGFVSIGHGRYRLDLPDAAVASGVPEVVISGTITGYIVAPCSVALSPSVNAVAVGGTAQTGRDIGASVLLSSGTGTGQLSLSSGAVLLQAVQSGVTIPTVTNLTNAPTSGDFTATMKTSIGTAVAASAVASVTGNVGGTVATVTNLTNLPTIPNNWLTAAGINANAFNAAKFDPDVTTELQAGLATSAALATVDDFVDDLETRVGTPTDLGGGASLAANNVDVEGQTDDLAAFIADVGANGSGLTAVPWNASWDVEVESEVDDSLGAGTGTALTAIPWNSAWDTEAQSESDDALRALFLDQIFASTYDPATKPGQADALLNELVESDSGVARFTANALEQGPAGGGGGVADWSADERTAIRSILGVPASGTTPDDPTTGILDTIRDDTDNLQTRTPAALVGGRTDVSVGAMQANVMTAAAAASDLTTELQTGLATAATQATTDGKVDTITTRIGTPTNLGGGASLAANNVDIEGQTDDIGVAGAGLTAADDPVMTRLGAPSGASIAADIAGISGGGPTADEVADEVQTRTIAGVTTVAGLGPNAITAAATAPDFKTEVTSGLATSSDVSSSTSSTAAAIAALNDLSAPDVGSIVVETEGGTISLRCALAAVLAYAAGDVTTTSTDTTYEDPSGSETRVTGSAPTPGNRNATVTCPSY